jgi:hypothetical protein
MKYIAVTHVDKRTKVPGFKAPMKNGPVFPDVKGLKVEWWDQSRWPIQHPDDYPLFYGTCDDDADVDIPGVMRNLAKENYDDLYAMELRARKPSVATPLQIRLALIKLGRLDEIQTLIANLEEPAKTIVMTEWEYALEIEKNSTTIQSIGAYIGLTEQEIDDIFELASNISPGSVDPFNPFPEAVTESEEG